MKELTQEFRNKLRKIKEDEEKKKRKTIFIDTHDINNIHYPWKHLTKDYKLILINEYITKNNIVLDEPISSYKFRNIEYEKNINTIHHIEFVKK
jgi:hypothetical protein